MNEAPLPTARSPYHYRTPDAHVAILGRRRTWTGSTLATQKTLTTACLLTALSELGEEGVSSVVRSSVCLHSKSPAGQEIIIGRLASVCVNFFLCSSVKIVQR
jgi:hypothetical protein